MLAAPVSAKSRPHPHSYVQRRQQHQRRHLLRRQRRVEHRAEPRELLPRQGLARVQGRGLPPPPHLTPVPPPPSPRPTAVPRPTPPPHLTPVPAPPSPHPLLRRGPRTSLTIYQAGMFISTSSRKKATCVIARRFHKSARDLSR